MATESAAWWAQEMARLRSIKPRPIAKLYGRNGPTPEQKTAWDAQMKAWNAAYRKASAEQKKALKRDNDAFYAQLKANPSILETNPRKPRARNPRKGSVAGTVYEGVNVTFHVEESRDGKTWTNVDVFLKPERARELAEKRAKAYPQRFMRVRRVVPK